ncbi:hypothetical protein [Vulcanisaeta sp. JCM 16161]|uniref:hypothetical protein n=1 Tax=Vulcanisaeta sp. JCM 16161 TaxID=1295372 RepID=UPI0006CF6916|nr:hypothetical protein [Vulcanisaeta sp. JCM 16161]
MATEVLYIEQPEGVRFYLRDVLNYPEYLECLDLAKIMEWFSRGLTWRKLEANPRLILRALPRLGRGMDVEALTTEALAIARRFILEYGVITPLLAWDELQDLVIDEADNEACQGSSLGPGALGTLPPSNYHAKQVPISRGED